MNIYCLLFLLVSQVALGAEEPVQAGAGLGAGAGSENSMHPVSPPPLQDAETPEALRKRDTSRQELSEVRGTLNLEDDTNSHVENESSVVSLSTDMRSSTQATCGPVRGSQDNPILTPTDYTRENKEKAGTRRSQPLIAWTREADKKEAGLSVSQDYTYSKPNRPLFSTSQDQESAVSPQNLPEIFTGQRVLTEQFQRVRGVIHYSDRPYKFQGGVIMDLATPVKKPAQLRQDGNDSDGEEQKKVSAITHSEEGGKTEEEDAKEFTPPFTESNYLGLSRTSVPFFRLFSGDLWIGQQIGNIHKRLAAKAEHIWKRIIGGKSLRTTNTASIEVMAIRQGGHFERIDGSWNFPIISSRLQPKQMKQKGLFKVENMDRHTCQSPRGLCTKVAHFGPSAKLESPLSEMSYKQDPKTGLFLGYSEDAQTPEVMFVDSGMPTFQVNTKGIGRKKTLTPQERKKGTDITTEELAALKARNTEFDNNLKTAVGDTFKAIFTIMRESSKTLLKDIMLYKERAKVKDLGGDIEESKGSDGTENSEALKKARDRLQEKNATIDQLIEVGNMTGLVDLLGLQQAKLIFTHTEQTIIRIFKDLILPEIIARHGRYVKEGHEGFNEIHLHIHSLQDCCKWCMRALMHLGEQEINLGDRTVRLRVFVSSKRPYPVPHFDSPTSASQTLTQEREDVITLNGLDLKEPDHPGTLFYYMPYTP